MKTRPRWALLGLGAIVVALLFTYPTWRKFLTVRGSAVDYALASEAQQVVFAAMRRTPGANPATAYAAMLITVVAPTDATTPDPASMTAIKSGDFVEIDAVHTAKGRAVLYRRIDNSLLMRFEDFSVTNGPSLNVYLSTEKLPKTADEMNAGQRQLLIGALKGNFGNQDYTRIPAELDLTRYKSVVLYSEDLKTVYTSAALN